MERIEEAMNRRWGPLLALTILTMAGVAWTRAFVLDDAFISFRYARNLVEGEGLVWNAGERVEGYTNFLWTILLAVPHTIGLDPVRYCYLIGPLLGAVTLYLSSRIAASLLPSRVAQLAALVLLGSNPSFASFATSGLETMLVAFLDTAILAIAVEVAGNPVPLRTAIVASVVAAAALLTRLDSASVVGLGLASIASTAIRRSTPGRSRQLVAALALPAALFLVAWFAWKWSYYGQLLPNTFYAKTGSGADLLAQGIGYLSTFLSSYFLWPLLMLLVWGFPRAIREGDGTGTLLGALGLHTAYVAWVGGDFMEFRFLVPVLPAAMVMCVWAIATVVPWTLLRVGLVGLVALGAVHHAQSFGYVRGIEPVEGLASHLDDPATDWIGIGRKLEMFADAEPPVRIALTPAGAIPYYSRLWSLDMLGLNDAWVARHGLVHSPQPGHNRVAPMSYMIERGTTLILAHPWVKGPSPPDRDPYTAAELRRLVFLLEAGSLPDGARVVEIPLDARRVLVAVYLTPHRAVDAAIRVEEWGTFALR